MASSSGALLCSLVLVFLLFSFSEAREIMVGGKADAWKIPSEKESLNVWSNATRFKIGDSLVWKYDHTKDSVLEVTEENYKGCNISSPIVEYKDGNTKVELNRSGPYCFISGVKENCEKGEKVRVVVLSPHHQNTSSPSPSPSPNTSSPSPSPSPNPGSQGVPAPSPAPAPNSSAHASRTGFAGALLVLGGVVGMFLF